MANPTNLIWNDATLAVGTHEAGIWYPLPDHFSAHGIYVNFTSANGVGRLEISYRLASRNFGQTGAKQGILLFAQNDELAPFTISMGDIVPMRYIKFISEVTIDTISGYTLDFVQTGRVA